MQGRFARRRFFGAAATLVLTGSASVRAWLDRPALASPLPPGDRAALDSTPTEAPTPTPPPTPVPTALPAPQAAPVMPTYGVSVAIPDALAPLLALDTGALTRQLLAALGGVAGASFVAGGAEAAVRL